MFFIVSVVNYFTINFYDNFLCFILQNFVKYFIIIHV